MENFDVSSLLDHMDSVSSYKSKFESLNGLLNKTTLTGKISNLEIAENLFNFMDETQVKFSELQANLIESLAKESFAKVLSESRTIAYSVINSIEKTLRERYFNLRYLAASSEIVEFLSNPHKEQGERERLKESLNHYIKIYSIYKNIIITDAQGNIVLSLKHMSLKSKDTLIDDALRAGDRTVSTFKKSEFGEDGDVSLLYANAVLGEERKTIGVVIGVLDFNDEVNRVFETYNFVSKDTIITFLNQKNEIVYTSSRREFPEFTKVAFKAGRDFTIINQRGREYLAVQSKAQKIEESFENSISCAVLLPLKKAFSQEKSTVDLEKIGVTDISEIMTDELNSIMNESENINEDLGDVVINGEIIASKSHSYSLNPILDSIRELSQEINNVFIESIKDLQETIINGYFKASKFKAYSAAELLDKFFYERVSEVRWLAKNRELMTLIKDPVANDETLGTLAESFAKINVIYKNIFIFDQKGKIVANSNSGYDRFKDKNINDNHYANIKRIKNTYGYYISKFEPCEFLSGDFAYTFYAPIIVDDVVIGGVGAVCDTSEELKTILNTVSVNLDGEAANRVAYFVTRDKKIVSTTDATKKLNSEIELDDKYVSIPRGEGVSDIVKTNGKLYVMGVQSEFQYRDFTGGEGPSSIISILFREIKR